MHVLSYKVAVIIFTIVLNLHSYIQGDSVTFIIFFFNNAILPIQNQIFENFKNQIFLSILEIIYFVLFKKSPV